HHPRVLPAARRRGDRMIGAMHRRSFLTLLGGAGASSAWPVATRAQQGERVRLVAALLPAPPSSPPTVALLRAGMPKLGWMEGPNLRLEIRIVDDPAALQAAVEELVKSAPEVIFANTGPVAAAVEARTRTIPIVFTGGGDPAQARRGLVRNIARPEGNI